MDSLIKKIMALVSVITVVFSIFFFFETRYTPLKDFIQLEKRVTLEELRRQLRQAEDDAAYYRQQVRKYPDDEDLKERLKKAEKRVKDLEDLIKKREEEGE